MYLYFCKEKGMEILNKISIDQAMAKRNGYRIVAVIIFAAGLVTIRFIGSHSEYDKIDCRTI
jgi:mRNA-degrading endonuclease HigB of HigAB toxin-antitoxin module